MKFTKVVRLSSIALVTVLVLLSGCTARKNTTGSVNFAGTPWEVTEYNSAEIIDENGEYILEKLNNATVSELKTVGDKQVIYHRGEPYLFHAMHMRIDHLMEANLDDATLKSTFEEGVKLIKESGYNTVILYFSWERFYDGKNYDFAELEYQYSIAKKYDLNIMWNWFGYDVCGFGGYRTWQYKDQVTYPPLRDENGNVIMSTSKFLSGELSGLQKPIPDLSVQSFIDIEVEAINQFCAWLNVNDTDRRTVGIQIENEPNHHEGGHGLWFSQYDALANLLDELGKAVKNGPYSMITYLNLMSAGHDQVDENGEQTVFADQVLGLIEKEYIDIVGYDYYGPTLSENALTIDVIEQGENPHLMVEFGPCVWSVPAQTNILLSNGYGIGYYLAIQYKDEIPSFGGFFRPGTKNDPFEYRDGTQILGGYYPGELELVASELIMMNHSIKALSQVIATAPNANMTYLNKNMLAKTTETNSVLGKSFTFATDCGNDRYGATALLIKADESTYYTYASKSATITLNGGIKSASEGVYKNGKWVKTKDIQIVDGKMTYEAGKAYRFII